MNNIENAGEELKRADHLIFVSLKYTRTCDILMNTIKRLIESFDFAILAILESLREKRKIFIIPENAIKRAELLVETEKKYKNHIKLYFLLRKIEVSEYDAREEYRKHVTMVVHLDKGELDIDVPKIEEYFESTKDFVSLVGGEL